MRCTFITLSNKVCDKITVASHEHCKFHSSLLERERHRLRTPQWALKIIPTQADSHRHFQSFPKDNYDYYDEEDAEPGIQPYTMFKSDKHPAVMPELTCRFMVTLGRLKGYYCDQPNESGSDFCCYHRSVIEVPDTVDYPVPIWTQCILPNEVDSRVPMYIFPWRNYNVMELLFLDTITAPHPSENKSNKGLITIVTEPISVEEANRRLNSTPSDSVSVSSELDPIPSVSVNKEPTPCPKMIRRVPLRGGRMGKQSKVKRMKRKEYTMYYECPGECQEPGCNCKVLSVPIQVVDFEPRQGLYRELDHGYIVKDQGGSIVITGIFDDSTKKMRALTEEEKEHALEHSMTVV
jgi:hypothetical protein